MFDPITSSDSIVVLTSSETTKGLQMANLAQFIPPVQLETTLELTKGEEGQFFKDTLANIEKIVDSMPKTYETDGQGYDAIAHLHYFLGSADIFLTEKDMEDQQLQAFGWICLDGDPNGGELGYVNLEEIFSVAIQGVHRFELDYHFEPKPLKEALKEKFER